MNSNPTIPTNPKKKSLLKEAEKLWDQNKHKLSGKKPGGSHGHHSSAPTPQYTPGTGGTNQHHYGHQEYPGQPYPPTYSHTSPPPPPPHSELNVGPTPPGYPSGHSAGSAPSGYPSDGTPGMVPSGGSNWPPPPPPPPSSSTYGAGVPLPPSSATYGAGVPPPPSDFSSHGVPPPPPPPPGTAGDPYGYHQHGAPPGGPSAGGKQSLQQKLLAKANDPRVQAAAGKLLKNQAAKKLLGKAAKNPMH